MMSPLTLKKLKYLNKVEADHFIFYIERSLITFKILKNQRFHWQVKKNILKTSLALRFRILMKLYDGN